MKNEVTNKLSEWMDNVSTNEKQSYKQMFGSNNKWKTKTNEWTNERIKD